MRPAVYILLLLTTAGCNSESRTNDQTDGQACTYRTDTLPLVLLQIKRVDDQNYEAIMKVDYIHYHGTMRYSEYNNGQFLSKGDPILKQLTIGKAYMCLEENIVKGTCVPHNTRIVLKAYPKPFEHYDEKYNDLQNDESNK